MKAKVFTVKGEVKGEVTLPKCFESKIREDIIAKALRAVFTRQAYGSYVLAGKEASASGKLSHARRAYKTLYGAGQSRVPRKTFTARGTRFSRAGAFVPGTVGGRKGHPPKVDKIWSGRINKKEKKVAFNSLIAATASQSKLKETYPKADFSKLSFPIVVEDKVGDFEKSKKLRELLNKILGNAKDILERNRVLLVSEKDTKREHPFIDSVKAEELNIQHLAPVGRIVVYTEGAIGKLKKK